MEQLTGLFAGMLSPIRSVVAVTMYSVQMVADHVVVLGSLLLFLVVIYYLKARFSRRTSVGDDSSSESEKNQISPIEEEGSDVDRPRIAGNEWTHYRRGDREKRTVDWVHDARSIYRRLMKPIRSPTNDNEGRKTFRRTPTRRRHSSVGPFQFARAAKDFIVHGGGGKFQRQMSEMNWKCLPKPPSEFFEPSEVPDVPQNEKPEIFYVVHNLKTLELPEEYEVSEQNLVVEHYEENEYLVRPGDKDDNMIVVLEGIIGVFVMHSEGKEVLVRKIAVGDSFFSLLSLLDILMKNEIMFRNVSVRAITSCLIARYNMSDFRISYERNPALWTRPIQIVLTRLLHVTLTTLYQYLGLSLELVKKRPDEKRNIDDRHRQTSNSNRLQSRLRPRVSRLNSADDASEQLTMATRWFAEVLHLGTSSEVLAHFQDRVRIENIPEKRLIVEQNAEDENLIMVLSGILQMSQEPVDGEDECQEEERIFVYPRELVGGLQLLTSEPSFFTLRSHTVASYAVISKKDFFELAKQYPKIIMPVAYSVIRRLSPFVRSVDFAIDWVLLDSGQAVYRCGDIADSIYVVLSGRLRSVENKQIIEEFGRGDVLGMIEVLQRSPRSTTVLAVRYSQLARLPEGLLTFVKMKFPQVGFRLVHLLGHYYTSSVQRTSAFKCAFKDGLSTTTSDPQSHIKNLHTIAVVAATTDVSLTAFSCELYHALSSNLSVLRLSSKKVAENLDQSVLEKFFMDPSYDGQADFRLMHWLNLQEDTFPLIIYVCDNMATNWTRRCLRQADAILFVASGGHKPLRQSVIEEYLNLNQDGIRTNKELILLWDENTVEPGGTFEWLKGSWFSGHHHIRIPKRMASLNNVSENDVEAFYEKNVFGGKVDPRSDFARLARILTGNAIGVVLGGGGARGAAHVGVLKALLEHGIPIDMIGGTSIGALIAGIYAQSDEDVQQRAKSWFMMMSSIWPKLLDLTYAHSAMFTGAGFNRGLQDLFSDSMIEDLWIPYFCITTDISNSEMRVHRSGPLWAYCRASMSLAGYLPPLCDPYDGHLLLDGGYVNNLPADVMKSMGANLVVAVDVGSASETNLYNYGDSLSGFWVLLRKFNPFAEPVKVLNMEEIQTRLAYVSCAQQLQNVKNADYCHYVRPPIDDFKTLDFHKFDLVHVVGYKHGKEAFRDLLGNNEYIKGLVGMEKLRTLKRRYWRNETSKTVHNRMRAPSFTNLAAQVSKVPRVRHKNSSNGEETSDEDVSEYWYDENFESDVRSQPAYGLEDTESLEAGYNSEPCTAYHEYSSGDEENGSQRKSGSEVTESEHKRQGATLEDGSANAEGATEELGVRKPVSRVRFELTDSNDNVSVITKGSPARGTTLDSGTVSAVFETDGKPTF